MLAVTSAELPVNAAGAENEPAISVEVQDTDTKYSVEDENKSAGAGDADIMDAADDIDENADRADITDTADDTDKTGDGADGTDTAEDIDEIEDIAETVILNAAEDEFRDMDSDDHDDLITDETDDLITDETDEIITGEPGVSYETAWENNVSSLTVQYSDAGEWESEGHLPAGVVFVRVRGFRTDSMGNTVYGPWSLIRRFTVEAEEPLP